MYFKESREYKELRVKIKLALMYKILKQIKSKFKSVAHSGKVKIFRTGR